MEQLLPQWANEPYLIAIGLVAASIVAAYAVEGILRLTLGALAGRTESDLDDKIVAALRMPVFMSVLMVGLHYAATRLGLPEAANRFTRSALATLAILLWARALSASGHAILEAFTVHAKKSAMVQNRTLPIFAMSLKVVVTAAAVYFMFLAWRIDLTAWLASAGIVGIAVGFAAKDTLANLFAGVFIVVDGPYQVGDYVVLDGELRGEVSHIGVRSTRVLTRDDVEITVPNAVIAGGKIINESGGPHVRQRLAVRVEAAYGSDVDQVRDVLLTCPPGTDNVCEVPTPQVRFREFGGSGLVFELLVWSDRPAARGLVLSDLNVRVYKAFTAAGIEIPYSKHDVYIKQMPERAKLAG